MSLLKVNDIQNTSSQDIRGKVIQVAQTFYDNGNSTWGVVTSPTEIMGVTLTSKAANSRFLVDVCLYYGHGGTNTGNPDGYDIYLFTYRNSTKIGFNAQATRSWTTAHGGGWYVSDVPDHTSTTYGFNYHPLNENYKFIDSPSASAGTSLRYSVQGVFQTNFFLNRTNSGTTSAACSAITVFEIAP